MSDPISALLAGSSTRDGVLGFGESSARGFSATRSNADLLRASSMATANVSRTAAARLADATSRRRDMALEGQVIQETVLADELAASEAAQGVKIRELEAALEGRAAAESAESSVEKNSRMLQASRSEDEEAKLRVEALELHLAHLESQKATETGPQTLPVPDSLLDRMLLLEAEEHEMSERVRHERQEEKEAKKATARLREQVLDLSGDCGVMLLDANAIEDYNTTEEAAFQQFRRALPHSHPARHQTSLQDLLDVLQHEREAVAGVLTSREDRHCQVAKQETQELVRQLSTLEEATLWKTRRLAAVQAELSIAGEAMAEVDDRLAEASTLRKENQLLDRQQAEWRRSESRMMQLAESLQKQRTKGAQSQAVLAARLVDLQRELPISATNRGLSGGSQLRNGWDAEQRGAAPLSQVAQSNEELKRQVAKLEEEKANLVHGQRGLDSFIRSKMPDIEARFAGFASSYPPSP